MNEKHPQSQLLCPPGAFSLRKDDLANKRIRVEAFTRYRGLSYLGQLLSGILYFHMFTLRNLYADYFMRNAGVEEAQAGIKIAGRNINNVRYADDTTLMAESEEELKGLLMKESERGE